LVKLQTKNAIMWFRQDLRVRDNPALVAASKCNQIFPLYIFDDKNAGDASPGAASKMWLYHSLKDLNNQLEGKLRFLIGDPKILLPKLVIDNNIESIFWNRSYEQWQIDRDTSIKTDLANRGYFVESFNGSLLWEPWQVMKKDGTPYKVFTPFYRKGCLNAKAPRVPLNAPDLIIAQKDKLCGLDKLNELNLLPKTSWDEKVIGNWKVGERAAHSRLDEFLEGGLAGYKNGRNYPIKDNVSRLSTHIHWGEISVNTIWQKCKFHINRKQVNEIDADQFFAELGWREFSYSLLYNFPKLPSKNLQERFDNFVWSKNAIHLNLWKEGKTGYPIVDAGMRQLWQTGYMHNRLRMIVGSFLVKNLLIDWRDGEKWFWETLVDADLASNSAGWQWIAGCGADAAPYFRIFNPVTQGEKFDPDGKFIKKYVPELSSLPGKYLFSPWEAPEEVLNSAGIKLGEDYPVPIVDLKKSREKALAAFAKLKETRSLKI